MLTSRSDWPHALDITLHLGTAGDGDRLRHRGPNLRHLADAVAAPDRLHREPRLARFHLPDLRGPAAAILSGGGVAGCHFRCHPRSEEHTSELQSLMRISYAVFCLKKKIKSSHT